MRTLPKLWGVLLHITLRVPTASGGAGREGSNFYFLLIYRLCVKPLRQKCLEFNRVITELHKVL